MFRNILMSMVLGLTCAAAANAGTTGPPDDCQTQGPVRVCSQNGFGTNYSVTYTGYLTGSAHFQHCRPDFSEESDVKLGGWVNGVPFGDQDLYGSCQLAGLVGSGIAGVGRRPTAIEIYFFDAEGNYDSVYGENYRFEFYGD